MRYELTDDERAAIRPTLPSKPRGFDLSAYLRQWLANAPKAKGALKLEVDVDPQSFL